MYKSVLPDGTIVAGTGAGYGIQGHDLWQRFRDVGAAPSGADADVEMRRNRTDYISVSRKMDETNGLCHSAIDRAAGHVLGPTGIHPRPDTGIDGVDRQIEEEVWGPAAENPELTGRFNWQELQELIFRDMLVAGDGVMSWTGDRGNENSGKWQFLKAERVRGQSPRRDDGTRIEQGRVLNKLGQTVRWNIAGVSDYGYLTRSDSDELPSRFCDYFHGTYRRADQHRAYPWWISALPYAHQVQDICTAEAIGWQVASRILAEIGNEDPDQPHPPITDDNSERRTDVGTEDVSSRITDIGYAMLFQGKPGQSIDIKTQDRPSSSFVSNVKLYISLFCLPLGIARELLMIDVSELNYSNFRGMLLQCFIKFRRLQIAMVNVSKAFYERQIDLALARGDLAYRPSIYKHSWDLPRWPWVDRNKEVEAWAKMIDRTIATQHEALSRLGTTDVDAHKKMRQQELTDAWDRAMEIEEYTDGRLSAELLWKTLAGLAPGKTEEAELVESIRRGATDNTENSDEE